MIPFIGRIHAYGGIGHYRLRTCRGYCQELLRGIAVTVGNEISQMVELAGRIPVDYLLVAHGGKPHRIPVHHPDAPVNVAFVVEIYESVRNRPAQIRIHGKFRPVPVA